MAVSLPSVLETTRSAVTVRVVSSVAELLLGLVSVKVGGGVIVAVLLSTPVADGLIVPETVNVAVALGRRLNTASIELPAPDAGPDELKE